MKTFVSILALLWAWIPQPALPQAAANANAGYKTAEGRARVAKTLAASDRDGRQKPRELVTAIGITPGSTVVDFGSGVGYMLPHLSQAVGPSGKVIAVDIFEDFLTQARQTAAKHGLTNVQFVLATDKDAHLAEESADLIFVLDAYHHFDYPEQTLASMRKALRPGGRLAIVDFYKNGFRDPNHIRADRDEVIREVEAGGFKLISKSDHLPGTQYIAIFKKN